MNSFDRNDANEGWIGVIIYILILSLTVYGYVHILKKHDTKTLILAIVIFPVADYYGIESFWHDDFAGVDWNKRLAEDFESAETLIMKIISNDSNNIVTLKEELKKLHEKVKDYPKDKKNELARLLKLYSSISTGMMKDFIVAGDSIYESKILNYHFELSTQTEKCLDSLNQFMGYKKLKEFEELQKFTQDNFNQFHQGILSMTDGEYQLMRNRMIQKIKVFEFDFSKKIDELITY
jgi:hypothetical protein